MDDSVYHGRTDYPSDFRFQYLVTILKKMYVIVELMSMWDSQLAQQYSFKQFDAPTVQKFVVNSLPHSTSAAVKDFRGNQ
jgi:hypothetical protein